LFSNKEFVDGSLLLGQQRRITQPFFGQALASERMSQDLQLRGMAKRTPDGYLREVRKLA